MSIENEIFNGYKVNYQKLLEYGFNKSKNTFKLTKLIIDNTFSINIEVNSKEKISVKVYDLSINDEYISFRINNDNLSFANKIKEEVINLLLDIRNKCYTNLNSNNQMNRITKLIKEKYKDEPEFLWSKFPEFRIFRNKDNKKWYAIIMNINKNKLNINSNDEVYIINIKLDSEEIKDLLDNNKFYPAYHMNKKYWITIILDENISDNEIMEFINKSYCLSKK